MKVLIIRHGEKPPVGDNLSPSGLSRALQLPAVLSSRFGIPDRLYVPALQTGATTSHARMFQTITPFAVQYNLPINSEFDEKDVDGIARRVREEAGMLLLVWEHHRINTIVTAIGIQDAPLWEDADFDSIWIITLNQNGEPVLTIELQHLTPLL